jgi:hypothetical protein
MSNFDDDGKWKAFLEDSIEKMREKLIKGG